MVVNSISELCFCFIKMFVVSLGIGGAVNLAISEVKLIRADFAVYFSGFFS